MVSSCFFRLHHLLAIGGCRQVVVRFLSLGKSCDFSIVDRAFITALTEDWTRMGDDQGVRGKNDHAVKVSDQ